MAYVPDAFVLKPTPSCYADALKYRALSYSRVTQALYYTKHCLGVLGKPFVFGFTVFDQFESDECLIQA